MPGLWEGEERGWKDGVFGEACEEGGGDGYAGHGAGWFDFVGSFGFGHGYWSVWFFLLLYWDLGLEFESFGACGVDSGADPGS